MRVRLAYGETGLDVDLPADRTTVVEPVHVAGASDPDGVLRSALRSPVAGPPLRQIVRPVSPWPSRCATAPGHSPGT